MSPSAGEYFALVLYALPGLIVGFVLHELAHAWTAVRLGDPTPRYLGRLTLDPRKHIDPMGLGLLLVVGFGWAKPVQFSTAYIRRGTQRAMVAAAGPLTNLVLAAVFAGLLHLEIMLVPDVTTRVFVDAFSDTNPPYLSFGHGGFDVILLLLLSEAFFINVVLFIFNSLPIPGLDGYHVASGLLGNTFPEFFRTVEANRQLVWGAALILLFAIPYLTNGQTNPLGTIITNTDNFLYHTFVEPGQPPPAGLPNITELFSNNTT